jgi:shikimate dehydrogenase
MTGRTGRFGLLGERLSHSYSPMIHAELGKYDYRLYEKKPDEIENFITHGDFEGLNVTIPYKTAVMPYCSELSETVRAVGSVNTVTRLADGSLYGDNTDYFGFSYLLKNSGIDPAAGKTIVLGSGGSSLTARAALRDLSAKEIVVVSRSGPDNYENIGKHNDATVIVNTTPVGMYPDNGVSPIKNLGVFQRLRAVVDMIYNPPRTELLMQAEDRGVLTANGLTMLVAQAKRASEQFMRAKIPDERIEEIIRKITGLTGNIVLIGMPGSGKSSIGAALAKKTGRGFADTDEWIIDKTGKSIPEIFAKDGEDIFRRIETDALNALCKCGGLVIATGGGIVNRKENRHIIRQNGTVVFLERDISELQVSGRPLSESEGVETLAKARLPYYLRWSDLTVSVRGVEQTAEEIYRRLTGDRLI